MMNNFVHRIHMPLKWIISASFLWWNNHVWNAIPNVNGIYIFLNRNTIWMICICQDPVWNVELEMLPLTVRIPIPFSVSKIGIHKWKGKQWLHVCRNSPAKCNDNGNVVGDFRALEMLVWNLVVAIDPYSNDRIIHAINMGIYTVHIHYHPRKCHCCICPVSMVNQQSIYFELWS